MERALARRIFYGLGANAYGQAVTVLVQLAGVPILLHAWGVQVYGVWLVFFSIPAYLSFADLGFTMSAANDMTQMVGRGDREHALSVFQSLCALVTVTAVGALAVVTLVVFITPDYVWGHFAHLGATNGRRVLWLLAAEVMVRFWAGVNHAGFRCNNDYALHVAISNTVTLAQYMLVWAAALYGFGMLGAAAAFALTRLVATPLVSAVLVKRHAWVRFGFALGRRAELRRLVNPSVANLALPVAQSLNAQGMILVVAAVLGPVAVVTFATLRTLTNLLVRLNGMISHTMIPEFATFYGRSETARIRALFWRMLGSQGMITLAGCVALLLLGNWLLGIWTHGRVAMDQGLFDWLLAASAASVLWHGSMATLESANRHVRAALAFVGGAAVAVALGYMLLRITHRLADAGMVLLVTDAAVAVFALLGVRKMLARHMLPHVCRDEEVP